MPHPDDSRRSRSVTGTDVTSVRFRNVPSFVLAEGIEVKAGDRTITCDIAYGGAFYASVDAADLSLTVTPRTFRSSSRSDARSRPRSRQHTMWSTRSSPNCATCTA